ncbi:complex I NDUFA9 subunit family protein [Amorphus orientalis]|uniref:NADH dehydrogenase n=1 Tax=Amorphus orientalis TaxID=649198 RepID=A0AAE3VLW0_9HYPH|nr:complex I NDUFA9 subunit family protein [Amorphus orientalis]MDQ0314140.1 NADH dehydrogenase [Amorphus orientalis]
MTEIRNDRLVTIFGGSGFVGRYLVRQLAKRGWRIRAAVRRPDLAGHLQPLGSVGQIKAVQANVRYRDSIDTAIHGADAVVNLVGILAQSGKQSFSAVQAYGSGQIAESAKEHGLDRIVQISALGADPDSESSYARSKAEGEAAVLETLPDSVIFRPSILFGPEDDFFNRFGQMSRISPVLPIVGPDTRFQPTFVGDVAEAIALAVEGGARPGTIYELGGPEVRTFRELMKLMLEEVDRPDKPIVAIPFGLAEFQAKMMSILPKPPLTPDQVRLLKTDNVVSPEAEAEGRTYAGLGINPDTLAAVLPTYLWRFRPSGEFDRQNVPG